MKIIVGDHTFEPNIRKTALVAVAIVALVGSTAASCDGSSQPSAQQQGQKQTETAFAIGGPCVGDWAWTGTHWEPAGDELVDVPDAETAVKLFAALVNRSPGYVADVRRALRGRDLACYCAEDAPCHGDVLLDLAGA